ncbi:uncharacterized protein LOC106988398 isoform X2 [Acinonyx jubatus]|uniref:Uncharacterized protein LOC106988398 isoform X2 n=1 Tax=Acinonyx jubatus TaxID=32536 RepID=A0ABM3P006_ACIJB|nr:uncharacterized protein LOC106988398 isoform X2 [Acinonyx jubatus]
MESYATWPGVTGSFHREVSKSVHAEARATFSLLAASGSTRSVSVVHGRLGCFHVLAVAWTTCLPVVTSRLCFLNAESRAQICTPKRGSTKRGGQSALCRVPQITTIHKCGARRVTHWTDALGLADPLCLPSGRHTRAAPRVTTGEPRYDLPHLAGFLSSWLPRMPSERHRPLWKMTARPLSTAWSRVWKHLGPARLERWGVTPWISVLGREKVTHRWKFPRQVSVLTRVPEKSGGQGAVCRALEAFPLGLSFFYPLSSAAASLPSTCPLCAAVPSAFEPLAGPPRAALSPSSAHLSPPSSLSPAWLWVTPLLGSKERAPT